MLVDANERAGVQEQFEVAGNASNMRVEADKRGPADLMIAAGWSPSRLGMALLRLHSEWSSAAKPKRLPPRALEVLVAQIKTDDLAAKESARQRGKPYTSQGSAVVRAQAEADRWFTNELRILANSLKSRAPVWEGLAPWAQMKGIPTEKVAEALLYWLHPSCKRCNGLGRKKHEDAPALSATLCHKCGGTGSQPHPEGTGSVLAYLDYSLSLARNSLKQRLRGR